MKLLVTVLVALVAGASVQAQPPTSKGCECVLSRGILACSSVSAACTGRFQRGNSG